LLRANIEKHRLDHWLQAVTRAAKKQFEKDQQEQALADAEFSGADGAVSVEQTDGEGQGHKTASESESEDAEMQDS
jgi:hypothetical protein